MNISETNGIQIEVKTQYVEERSAPSDDYYFFAYHVKISNSGSESAQLMSRRWIITDAEGHVGRKHVRLV